MDVLCESRAGVCEDRVRFRGSTYTLACMNTRIECDSEVALTHDTLEKKMCSTVPDARLAKSIHGRILFHMLSPFVIIERMFPRHSHEPSLIIRIGSLDFPLGVHDH